MELKKGLIPGLAIGLSGCATLHNFRLQAEAYCAEFGFTQGTEDFQACTMLKKQRWSKVRWRLARAWAWP